MENLTVFKKLLQQIMSIDTEPLISEEEIHFDQLAKEVMELTGDRWVVWLN